MDRKPNRRGKCPRTHPFLQMMKDGETECCYKTTTDPKYGTKELAKKFRESKKQIKKLKIQINECSKSNNKCAKLEKINRDLEGKNAKYQKTIKKLRRFIERVKDEIFDFNKKFKSAVIQDRKETKDKIVALKLKYHDRIAGMKRDWKKNGIDEDLSLILREKNRLADELKKCLELHNSKIETLRIL